MAVFATPTKAQTPTACPGHRTYTQGGWGGNPRGNNPAAFLRDHFEEAFPDGLEIGCMNTLSLSSATAVRNFLPQGGTPSALQAGDLVDPTRNDYDNVLAGQLVALTLNVEFDRVFPSFGTSDYMLADLLITSGPFMGWSVGQLLDAANEKIGGCGVQGYTFSQFNQAVSLVNRSYDNGISSNTFLACPIITVASVTPASCFGSADGTIALTVTGGVGPYSYSWSNGATSQNLSGLAAGTYTVTVNDLTLQVSSAASFLVGQPDQISVTSTVSHASCNIANGPSDGSILLSTAGGTGSHTVTWSDGFSGIQRTGLQAGRYCYTVTDANQCTVSDCIEIEEPAVLSVSIGVQQPIVCHGDCNAILNVDVTGGTAAYSFLWEDNSTSAARSGMCNGTYQVSVTDQNGCTAQSAAFALENPPVLQCSGSIEDISSCNTLACDGIALVGTNGGIAPYSYTWHLNGMQQPASGLDRIEGLCQGDTVHVIVTDSRGCSIELGLRRVSCRYSQCDTLLSYTQGGWGARPRANNAAGYLHTNFASAFPTGLQIGCTNTFTLTSAQAVTDFLPSGSVAAVLPAGALVDAIGYKNVLAGQLTAAKLNVGFDLSDAAFSTSSQSLRDQYFTGGAFSGVTLGRVIEIADSVIGGCLSGYALADLNLALTLANENYDNGTVSYGYLACVQPSLGARVRERNLGNDILVFPNPASNTVNLAFNGEEGKIGIIQITDILGKTLYEQKMVAQDGVNTVRIPIDHIHSQHCLISVRFPDKTKTVRLLIER